MKITVIIVRSLIGLLFLFASVSFFLKLAPEPALTGNIKLFMEGLTASGYLLPLVKAIELLCGIAFIAGRFVPLATILIAPIAVNILLVNIFLISEGLPIAIAIIVGLLFLTYVHREKFEPIFSVK